MLSSSSSVAASGYDECDSSDCETSLSEGVEVDISGLGPSQPKKARKEKRATAKGSASTKEDKFAYYQVCSKNFMVSQSGFSDIRHHCEGLQHTTKSPKKVLTSLVY